MTLITTQYDRTTTADEVAAGHDLTGQRAVVTGAASGIGVETARSLERAGAEVTLAVRDVAAGERVATDIRATTGSGLVHVARVDLLDRSTVARFVEQWSGPLHLLINNAGIMALPELTLDADGRELQFATNHLGHFALTVGLHDALAAADGARVVSVSSTGHLRSPVVFDDLDFAKRPYDPWSAYGQSKTANALFAVGASARWADDGIVANSCMPGGIWTGLQKHWDPDVLAATKVAAADAVKTPEQGAATSVLLATAPELAEVRGRYYEDCHEAEVVDEIVDGLHGVRAWALDPAQADRLWDVSLALVDAEARSRA